MGNIFSTMMDNMIKNDPDLEEQLFVGPVMTRKGKWAFVGVVIIAIITFMNFRYGNQGVDLDVG